MNRAAILPFPGDPFLLNYWMMHFERFWEAEIGTLYVFHNSSMEHEVANYIRRRVERNPKAQLLYEPQQLQHGDVINRVLDIVREKYVMLIEDDAFIFKSGVVAGCFQKLESGQYDLVGSKRGSCSTEIEKAAAKRWGLSYLGAGDQGCNFWPNFLFTHRDILTATDRNFNAKLWHAGEYIPALDYTLQNDAVGDTFVNTSLQLHNAVAPERILYVPQYHGHPDDLEHYQKHQFLFDGNAPWCHIGSLSSGVGGILCDNEGRQLSRRTIEPPKGETVLKNAPKTDFEKREYERRVQWWLAAWEARETGEIEAFGVAYRQAIDRVITQFSLKPKRIHMRRRIYNELGVL